MLLSRRYLKQSCVAVSETPSPSQETENTNNNYLSKCGLNNNHRKKSQNTETSTVAKPYRSSGTSTNIHTANNANANSTLNKQFRRNTSYSPNCSPQRMRLGPIQAHNILPSSPTSPSTSRAAIPTQRKRTISSSSGSPSTPRVNMPCQMKLTSKVYKRPFDNLSPTQQLSCPKFQGQKPISPRKNSNLKYEKEHDPSSTLHNVTNSDTTTKSKFKKGIPKESTSKSSNQPLYGIKYQDNPKVNIVPVKSPSPPPLPAPSNFISSSSIQTKNKQDVEGIHCDKANKPSTEKNKQYLRSSKTSATKSREFGKPEQYNKVSTRKCNPKEDIPVRQRKSKISLPYDNEFCCDDDKFHLLGKDCRREAEDRPEISSTTAVPSQKELKEIKTNDSNPTESINNVVSQSFEISQSNLELPQKEKVKKNEPHQGLIARKADLIDTTLSSKEKVVARNISYSKPNNTKSTIPFHPEDEKDWKHTLPSSNNSNSENNNHWSSHKAWIPVFGKDIIVNLFSPDWELREMAVTALSREISHQSGVEVALNTADYDKKYRKWRCGFEILVRMVEDERYDVYMASITCFENILNVIQEHNEFSFRKIIPYIKPIFQAILSKCGDSNERIAETSRATMLKWCSNEIEAMNGLSKRMMGCSSICGGRNKDVNHDCSDLTYDYEAIDMILHFINEDEQGPPSDQDNNIRYTVGRLMCLNVLLKIYSAKFISAQRGQTHQRLMISLDFVFRHLEHEHPSVHKSARKVFLVLSEIAFKSDTKTNCQLIKQLVNTIKCSNLRMQLLHRIDYLLLHGHKINPSEKIKQRDNDVTNSEIKETDKMTKSRRKKSVDKENNHMILKTISKNSAKEGIFKNISNKPHITPKPDISNVKDIFMESRGCVNHAATFYNKKEATKYDGNKRTRKRITSIFSDIPSKLLGKRKMSSVMCAKEESNECIDQKGVSKNPSVQPNFVEAENMVCLKRRRYEVTRIETDASIDEAPIITVKNSANDSECLHYQTDDGIHDGGPNYDKISAIPSPTVDHVPLPYIPGLTVNKRANCSKKCFTPEHFHKNDMESVPNISHIQKSTNHLEILENDWKNKGSKNENQQYQASTMNKEFYNDIPHLDDLDEPCGYREGVEWTKATLLGSGAYSCCYQARDVLTGTIMAVKQISNLNDMNYPTQLNEAECSNNINVIDENSKHSPDNSLVPIPSLNDTRYERRSFRMEVSQFSTIKNKKRLKPKRKRNKTDDLSRVEVEIMTKIDHPHVIRLHGSTYDDLFANQNIFFEWMAGGSVSQLLQKHGPFTEHVICSYIYQTLLGLEYLHQHGILHRDLKGANLLIDSTGLHLRIGDFGAAATMQSVHKTLKGEFQGELEGTIAFMAPEVLRGESYGRSCDIWSLGCCLIEMATAKPPWNASDVSNHLALIYKIACSAGPPPIPSQLSPGLFDLGLCCLERNPHQRPSAKEILKYHPLFTEAYCTTKETDTTFNV